MENSAKKIPHSVQILADHLKYCIKELGSELEPCAYLSNNNNNLYFVEVIRAEGRLCIFFDTTDLFTSSWLLIGHPHLDSSKAPLYKKGPLTDWFDKKLDFIDLVKELLELKFTHSKDDKPLKREVEGYLHLEFNEFTSNFEVDINTNKKDIINPIFRNLKFKEPK